MLIAEEVSCVLLCFSYPWISAS